MGGSYFPCRKTILLPDCILSRDKPGTSFQIVMATIHYILLAILFFFIVLLLIVLLRRNQRDKKDPDQGPHQSETKAEAHEDERT
jgi:flagellar biosynthesis/type III secretory pathway M-ring protein FliF/YscJ